MSTNAYIADPVVNQYLHASLQNAVIGILAGLIITGIILIYISWMMHKKQIFETGI
ncbi:MAG: hypothetical protein LUQ50_11725 [Methanospirillum sp.]|uniref:hypothetical protein n=1 Tax=Methanospirillum sp. TaxID=45200 RepID=UPI002374F5E4|nr:hypothetical protein [Methanospirillum sp.]MDD1729724.1 hypothetical protein [Methanospirillum sp.]